MTATTIAQIKAFIAPPPIGTSAAAALAGGAPAVPGGYRLPPSNAIFDESGHFVLFPTMMGIKVVNTVTNKVCARSEGATGSRLSLQPVDTGGRFVCYASAARLPNAPAGVRALGTRREHGAFPLHLAVPGRPEGLLAVQRRQDGLRGASDVRDQGRGCVLAAAGTAARARAVMAASCTAHRLSFHYDISACCCRRVQAGPHPLHRRLQAQPFLHVHAPRAR